MMLSIVVWARNKASSIGKVQTARAGTREPLQRQGR
jgi:hypothetical protein